jgi:hypothetical protein
MLRYKGGGFLPDIPARDLSDEEARRFGEATLVASGFYEKPKQAAKRGREVTDGGDQSPASDPAGA